MKTKKPVPFALVYWTALALALLGITIGIRNFRSARAQLLAEHQTHLEDIGKTVDQNTRKLFNRVRSELANSVAYAPDFPESSPIFHNAMVADVLLLDQEEPMQSLSGKVRNIRIFRSDDPNDICLCEDGEGHSYLLIPSRDPDDRCGALINVTDFYRDITLQSITVHYWVVLYERDSNLMLQNDEDQPDYLLLSREEIAARKDGYSLLQQYELEDRSGTDRYSYTRSDGVRELSQITILASCDSQNGCFAIGIAADEAHIVGPASRATAGLTLGFLLIIISIVLLLRGIQTHQRRYGDVRLKLDMTEELLEKQMELARNQRLESMGVMSGAIAHEFNNLLTPILGYSLMSMEKLPEESGELYDNLLAIYQAADRARITVRRLSDLTRKQNTTAYVPLTADELLRRVLEISLPSKPKTVTLTEQLRCPELQICGDETQLVQILLNLVLNAYQAVENSSGCVTVSTRADEDQLIFTVTDTGPGIPPELLERIFEPFFTTKEVGKGSGLGLAIARQLAENHGGTIRVRSAPGAGASFELRLPVFRAEGPDKT